MRTFVCTLFVITMAMNAFGQNKECTHDLTIIVIDSDTKQPIEGVTAFISKGAQMIHSDSNGEIHFKNLCLALYEIELHHLNHKPHKESILITKNKQPKLVLLNCHIDTLKAITILGKKSNFQKEVLMLSKLKADDLFKSQNFSIGKSLEKINGVYNLSTGNHIQKPIIRGLYGNRVLVIHNDIRLEGQQWGSEHAPEVDAMSIKEVELIRGAQSIEYGSDAIGGVIILKPKSIYKITKTNGEIISGFNTNGKGFAQSLMIEGTLNKMKSITWRMQGDFKKSGNTKTPDYYLKNTGMNEINGSVALGYQSNDFKLSIHHTFFKSKIGIFSGSHIGNITDLYNAFHASKPVDSSGFSYQIGMPYQSIIHQTTKAEMIYQLKKFGAIKATFAYQKNNRDEYEKTTSTLQSDGSYKPSLSYHLNTYQFDLKFSQTTQATGQGI
ncbi:MAG: TonB-dependent receptor plug domain-containing protein, partial [Chitinophagaceae bacterium]|nr:TonB-dependent receptor plug domain-containing protein [Chitinophagaceae bacterium]